MTRKLSWIFWGVSCLGFAWPFFADATLGLDGYEILGHFVLAFFWIVFSSCLAILCGFLAYRSAPAPRPLHRQLEFGLLLAPLGVVMVFFLMSL